MDKSPLFKEHAQFCQLSANAIRIYPENQFKRKKKFYDDIYFSINKNKKPYRQQMFKVPLVRYYIYLSNKILDIY